MRAGTTSTATKLLIGAAAVALLGASAIHFGVMVPIGVATIDDPFPGAALPEGVIGVTLLLGLAAVLVAPRTRAALLAATLFATALTIYGLSVTLGSGRGGDIVYHVALLSCLFAALVLLTVGDRAHPREAALALRLVTLVDAGVFLAAAAQNMGARIAVGPIDWYFAAPIVQAGIGEAVIALGLIVAGITMRRSYLRVAYGLSIFGITFGLLSQRVVGAPREVHVLLVPLAAVGTLLSLID